MENNIRQLGHHMNMVWQCGCRLVHLNTSFMEQFTRMLVDIESKISMDSAAHQVLGAMADSGMAYFRSVLVSLSVIS